jgi:hypothetical protein
MPEARMRIARIYRDRLHDPVRAAEEFRGVYGQFETSLLRDDALYEMGAMWIDAGQQAEGCAMLRRVVAEFEVGHARRLASRRIEAWTAAGVEEQPLAQIFFFLRPPRTRRRRPLPSASSSLFIVELGIAVLDPMPASERCARGARRARRPRRPTTRRGCPRGTVEVPTADASLDLSI